MKVCPTCKENKEDINFYLYRGKPNGLCKPCHKNYCRVKNKEYYKSNKARLLLTRRDRTLKQYGLTKDNFSEMLEAQNRLCALCNNEIQSNPVVDHCHATGKVRGILHNTCNILLGMAKDNPEILLKAINYLKERA